MRTTKPSGREVAEKARGVRLDKNRSFSGVKNGKNVKFTPANIDHIKTLEEFEEGQVVGVLENDLEGDESNLPVGKYNVFLANVNGEWHAYAESGGNVAAEAARVEVSQYKIGEGKSTRSTFNPNGWCCCWCLLSWWGRCYLWACICW